ncbi:stage II sporulation protein P [Bacillus sp. FJAT-44742]|uniref:stage II sporulation protein P n=1 Tax=Bacillus sp. FJAT-44742 TaxID=2014005 RepID=UPI001E290292|nr:stage II sporulation protein P [Bacillus sp. FJAT-44742]
MKNFKKQRIHPIFAVERTSIKSFILFVVCGLMMTFILVAMLTSFEHNKHFSSTAVHGWTNKVHNDVLVEFLSMENVYFGQALPEGHSSPSFSAMAFEMMTSVNFEDPRTFLGRELPGFALFDGRIVVAGEGTDFTTMPIESAPPMEVLMEEREASEVAMNETEKTKETPESVREPGEEAVAHIIHSHSRESFLPELEEGTQIAFHPDVNITKVGEKLGEALEKRGIKTDVDTSDIEAMLQEQGLDFPQSYDVSRDLVKEAIAENEKLDMFFEIHRDSQPRDITTITINGEVYARTFFVIGENHANYEKNLAMAKDLHNRLEKSYPGLSRGVLVKGGGGSNGRYNQDLSERSILIEMGGIENSLDEVYRSTDIMAEVISEFYWDGEEVDSQGDD